MRDLVVRGCDVLVEPGDLREQVDLVLAGERVAAVGVGAAGVGGSAAGAGARELDGRGLLAIPGLVNAHTHSPENCLRGVGEGLGLEPWLMTMFGAGGDLDAEAHEVTVLAGAAEMLRNGTTSVIDHLWMTPPSPRALDAALRAYAASGMRATVAPLMEDRDVTDQLAAQLGLDVSAGLVTALPEALGTTELLAVLRHAFETWHGAEDGRLRILAGPGGVQWASDELLLGSAELAARHGGGVHIHLLETTVQAAACRAAFGRSGLQRLADLGLVGPGLSLPHSVWIEAADVETIAAGGATVVHNPAANTRLGSGRAPIAALLRAGAHVALGTDGSASSDNQSVWDAMKLAALIHNDADADVWVGSAEVLRMATTGGVRVMARGGGGAAGATADGLGTLRPGAPADFALLDRRVSGLAGAFALEPSLVLSEDGRAVRHVFVAGRQLVADGRCLTIDEADVNGRLRELAQRRARDADPLPAAVARAVGQMRALRQALAERGP
ncbi:amidohydrolase family protein [Conexibacter woesei]|uniref:amidohydrolase family protein n=1 Tax=Conexibacter woesei TaxID=191495 RepID=UPI001F217A6E|nr:amidohydrolase family protein [Conexibacter woesei]